MALKLWEGIGAAIGAAVVAAALALAISPSDARGETVGDGASLPLSTGGAILRAQEGYSLGADDTAAYALVFRDGTMVIKVGPGRPSAEVVPETQALAGKPMRWFGADEERPGASVPWALWATVVRTVVIDESFKAFAPVSGERWFAGFTSLRSVTGWENVDTSSMDSAAGMFEGCSSLVRPDLTGLDLSGVSNISGFYRGCVRLAETGLEGLDLSGVRDASGLLEGCVGLAEIDLGRLDLSGAVNLSRFLSGCSSLRDVTAAGLAPLAATDLSGFFEGCSSLTTLDLAGFSTPRAERLAGFLGGCSSLEVLDLGDLDLSVSPDASGLLEGCPALKTLRAGSGWKNSRVSPLVFETDIYRLRPSCLRIDASTPLPNGAGEYRSSDIALQLATVVMDSPYYVKTGKEIRPKVDVLLEDIELREGIDYTLSYEDNVRPGEATVTVHGIGAFSGGLVVPFSITELPAKVGDRIVYRTKQAAFTFEVTKTAWKGGVSRVNVTLRKVAVTGRGVKRLTVPSTFEVSGRKGTVTAIGARLAGDFKNVTSITVGGKVVAIGQGAFAKAKKARVLIVKTASLKSAKNCLKGSKIEKVEVKTKLSKAKRASYKARFTKKAGKPNVRFSYNPPS